MNASPAETPLPSLDEVLSRLSRLHPHRIDLTLERVERLLAALDHPERNLPPVIHVAGTNGKGSTLAFLRAMLEAAGLRVHVYTSPWLVRINESIRLGGALVGDDELRDALLECERVNAGSPITRFEIETVAAFLLFARHPADAVLLVSSLLMKFTRPAATYTPPPLPLVAVLLRTSVKRMLVTPPPSM